MMIVNRGHRSIIGTRTCKTCGDETARANFCAYLLPETTQQSLAIDPANDRNDHTVTRQQIQGKIARSWWLRVPPITRVSDRRIRKAQRTPLFFLGLNPRVRYQPWRDSCPDRLPTNAFRNTQAALRVTEPTRQQYKNPHRLLRVFFVHIQDQCKVRRG